MAKLIYMVRHGAPPPSERRKYWGRADPGWDTDNDSTIRQLVPMCQPAPGRIMSSPLLRARRTANLLSTMAAVTENEALAEIDFGQFDGLSFDEVRTRFPDQVRLWAEQGDNYQFPDGESVSAFFSRSRRVWKSVCEASDDTVMIVSHGGVISAWMCFFLDLPLARRFSFAPAYSTLTAFARKPDGGWNLRFFNNA